ncbi:type II toxin-antitoxin system VapC family toxin [Actinokineospora sp. HUAS TT18]|uniref:type II toxin-antitoxin system VapC family toxin n=1 Tax=Actinokineospora sp. HUAS TT18 TaxID=3447451 RepID=UPI003F51F0BB
MIVYFDTSALIPLLVDEPSSARCARLWDEAEAVASTKVLYVEAAAALAQALRMDRLTVRTHRTALRTLTRLWSEMEIIEVDDILVGHAAELALTYALRGYDALHCASAARLGSDDLVVAGGDRKLLAACTSLGLATADINATV